MLNLSLSHVDQTGLIFSREAEGIEANVPRHRSVEELGPRSEWEGLGHVRVVGGVE